jgi:sacsin
MPLIPAVGRAGGQKYDVAKAIRTFLEQMAGGAGFSFGDAVIKELIQNADDAGATELVVALDEREGSDLPIECRDAYGPLLEPALLIRNDAPFRIAGEVPAGDQDDFTAICEVAGGHKRFNPTAAGRFGIGFNTVYFLTDTPVLFSRREVHLFDLRRLMFADDGWRFSLDDFPATASNAGPIKTVLEWALPKAVLGDSAFQEIASDGRHSPLLRHFRVPIM